MAFYGATPEKQKSSRWEQIQNKQLRQREEDGSAVLAQTEIHLPEVPSPWTSLVGLFSLSGQVSQTGMGLCPLSWAEIQAFIEVNELDLTLYEKELIKKMSEAYCSEHHAASDPKRPAPYKPEVEEDEVDNIGKALGFMEQLRLLRRQED